jgi:ribonuclease R
MGLQPNKANEIEDFNKLQRVCNGLIPEPYEEKEDTGGLGLDFTYDFEDDAVGKAHEHYLNMEEEVEFELENNDERKDLRDLPTVTIDPDYAHDHDDAITVFEEEDGYRAFVHIADVTHYVDEDSEIDRRAQDRGVTVYLGENTRNMLPPLLAQEVCSLKPGADKLTQTAEMKFNQEGELENYDIYKSVIESDAHLTHTHAEALLENRSELEDWYDENELAHEDAKDFKTFTEGLWQSAALAEKARDNRWDNSLILNKDQSIPSQIVEELMIKANESAGRYIADELDEAGIYRVLDSPDKGWEDEAEENLREVGYELDLSNQALRRINDLFESDRIEEGDEEKVKKAIVTAGESAEYNASKGDPIGHFGLGTELYAHWTSPIRRRSDMVVHRITGGDFEGDFRDLERAAHQTTFMEDIQERAARLWHDANT